MADDHVSTKPAVYVVAGMERATVRKDIVYRTTDAGAVTLDVYSTAEARNGEKRAAVIFIAGYNDAGYEKMLGRKFKEMAGTVSWCQLIAASNMIAIAYTNREPVPDLEAALHHVREHAADLGIDEDRIGVWACSGNVPLALHALMTHGRDVLKAAALVYGYMIDVDGATGVAD